MKEILHSPYKKFFLFGLLCIVVSSWFSMGYQQMDEHFMILEFSNYRLGLAPQNTIPWEYTEKIRPSLQPTIAHSVFQAFHAIGIHSPFFHVFVLRLLAGLLAWFVSCKVALRLAGTMADETVRKWWIMAVSCLWFMPYLGVRFSSENFAGFTLMAGLLVVPGIFKRGNIIAANARWFFSGLLLASAFYFRFQIAFSIIGILLWLLLYARPLWKAYVFLFLGALVAVGINLMLDHWFYNAWVLTPFNYFEANIVKDAASTYGTTPWYDYIVLFVTQGIPPISCILLVLFIMALVKKPMQLMMFVFIPFILGHMLVPHKEFRFIFPMILPFLALSFSGLQEIRESIKNKKWLMPAFRVLVVFNLVLMAYRCFWPASNTHSYYKYLYNYAQDKPVHLITIGRGVFDEGYNQITLYRPKYLAEDTTDNEAYPALINTQNADSVLVMSYHTSLPYHDPRYTEQLLYVHLPQFLLHNNFNDWQARSDIWSLWLLRKKK